ncbi:MAG: hypothetical protein ACTSXD_08710 [Candidatus Heimdallarchaeaceae archaeon]
MSVTYSQGGGAFSHTYLISADTSGTAVWRTSKIVGKIVSWLVIPFDDVVSSVGLQTVTNLFDFTLTDNVGFDVLRGNGANMTTATQTGFFEADGDDELPINTIGDLLFTGENMGSTGTLTLRIYFKED